MVLEGPGPWLTLAEAARRHGIPVKRLQDTSADGRLSTRKVGRSLWVLESDLAAYLERVRYWYEGKRTGRPRKQQVNG